MLEGSWLSGLPITLLLRINSLVMRADVSLILILAGYLTLSFCLLSDVFKGVLKL